MMALCEQLHVYEYIPSIRQTDLCHYHERYYDAACTLGAYHPLLYEKSLIQRIHTGPKNDLRWKGRVTLPGLSTVNCDIWRMKPEPLTPKKKKNTLQPRLAGGGRGAIKPLETRRLELTCFKLETLKNISHRPLREGSTWRLLKEVFQKRDWQEKSPRWSWTRPSSLLQLSHVSCGAD